MKDIHPFYAVKCNPDPVFIEVLAKEGFNFDCASPAEIDLVLRQGVTADRILYANPFKRATDIAYAYQRGVRCTTFDTTHELEKIMQTCPEMQVILRIYANDPSARCCLSNKFGAHRHDWVHLLACAQKYGAQLIGVSFHVGSGAASPNAFTHAISECKDFVDMAKSMGFDPRIIDIGGGFSKNTLNQLSNPILQSLSEHFSETDYQWIAEPGRYFAEDAMTLYTKVMGIRENADATMNYIITDGLYGSFNGLLYDHSVIEPKTFKHLTDKGEWRAATLYGPTCDGFDCIGKNVPLPRLQIGDIIYFENMGAYTIGAACDFNGIQFTKIKKIYI
jgi:ornithine decarboxylase